MIFVCNEIPLSFLIRLMIKKIPEGCGAQSSGTWVIWMSPRCAIQSYTECTPAFYNLGGRRFARMILPSAGSCRQKILWFGYPISCPYSFFTVSPYFCFSVFSDAGKNKAPCYSPVWKCGWPCFRLPELWKFRQDNTLSYCIIFQNTNIYICS